MLSLSPIRPAPGRLLAVLLTSASLTATMLPVLPAQAQEVTAINIPAGALDNALRSLGRQTGLQISFRPQDTAGRRAAAVSGPLTPEAALDRLLSGTALNWHREGASSVVITAAGAASGAYTEDGSVMLGTIVLSGAGAGSTWATPGGFHSVTAETLDRVPTSSPGDILKGVPGVIASNNRAAPAVEPMIRGVQGQERVSLIVDGVESSSNTYKGYAGNSQNFYIDPDLIDSYSVEKGSATDGGSAIGGRIEMRTVGASDLVRPGKTWGGRVKLGFGNNSHDGSQFDACTGPSAARPDQCINPSYSFDPAYRAGIPGRDYSASLALGWRPSERLSFVFGYSKRESGNYRAGRKGDLDFQFINTPAGGGAPTVTDQSITSYDPGAEIFGTYSKSDNLLLKAHADLGNDQEISFVFSRMDIWNGSFRGSAGTSTSYDPYPRPATTDQQNIGIEYRWNPADNRLVDLEARAWRGKIEEYRVVTDLSRTTINTGLSVANTSRFDVLGREASLRFGIHASREDLAGERGNPAADWQLSSGQIDRLALSSTFRIGVTDWLGIEAGLRHDRMKLERDLSAGVGTNDNGITHAKFSATTGHLRATAQLPWEGAQAWIGYSTGWRAPSMREVSLRQGNMNGAPLRPEEKRSIDLGVAVARSDVWRDGDTLGVKLGYFDNKYTDYIAGNGYIPGFYNARSLHHRGLELALSYDAGPFYVEYGLTHYLKAQACNYTIPGVDGCALGYSAIGDLYGIHAVPKNLHSLTIGGRFLENKLDLGMRLTHSTDTASNVRFNTLGLNMLRTNYSKPYTTVDLYGKYQVTDLLRVDFSVENLTDRFYLDAGTGVTNAIPAPGRTLRLGLTSKF